MKEKIFNIKNVSLYFDKNQIKKFLEIRDYKLKETKFSIDEPCYHNSFEKTEYKVIIPFKNGKFEYSKYGEIKRHNFDNLDLDHLKHNDSVFGLFEHLFVEELFQSILQPKK